MKKKINLIFHKSKESFEKQQKENINPRYFECPRCKSIIKLMDIDIKITVFECPVCGQKNIFPLELLEIEREESHNISWLSKFNTTVCLLGLCLIITGIFFLFQPNPLNIKVSITFFIIGVICPMFLIEKNNISVKLTFGSIVLIIILFLTTGTDLEIFFILIFLGLFIMKIIIDNYIPAVLNIRMDIIISAFFIIFIILVIKRIINILSI